VGKQRETPTARAQGYNVWGEYYPFAAESTLTSADFLRRDLWEKVNGYKYEETIYDLTADKFLTKDEYLKAVKEHGRVQVGKVADLKLFDPVKVATRSSYKAGEQGLPPVGIPYVIVNGTIAVKNGQVLNVNPGQPIRYPVEPKGRFEPVEVNKWLDDHAIKTPGELSLDDTGATKVIENEVGKGPNGFFRGRHSAGGIRPYLRSSAYHHGDHEGRRDYQTHNQLIDPLTEVEDGDTK